MPLFKKKNDAQQVDAESQSVIATSGGSAQAPLETYKVVYKGGHPDYPKSKVAEIRFLIFGDRFEFPQYRPNKQKG